METILNESDLKVRSIVVNLIRKNEPFTVNDVYNQIKASEGRLTYGFQLRSQIFLERLVNAEKLKYDEETFIYSRISKYQEYSDREIKRNNRKLINGLETAKNYMNIDKNVCDEGLVILVDNTF